MNDIRIIENFRYKDMIEFSIKTLKPYSVSDHMISETTFKEDNDSAVLKADIEMTRLFCCDENNWKLLTFNAYDILSADNSHSYYTVFKQESGNFSKYVKTEKLGFCLEHLSKDIIDSRLKPHDIFKITNKEKLAKALGVKIK